MGEDMKVAARGWAMTQWFGVSWLSAHAQLRDKKCNIKNLSRKDLPLYNNQVRWDPQISVTTYPHQPVWFYQSYSAFAHLQFYTFGASKVNKAAQTAPSSPTRPLL